MGGPTLSLRPSQGVYGCSKALLVACPLEGVICMPTHDSIWEAIDRVAQWSAEHFAVIYFPVAIRADSRHIPALISSDIERERMMLFIRKRLLSKDCDDFRLDISGWNPTIRLAS